MAISLGQTVMGMWLWDLMRLADYALTCDCVNGHISCVGFSGGGYLFGSTNSVQFGAKTENYLRALELVRERGIY